MPPRVAAHYRSLPRLRVRADAARLGTACSATIDAAPSHYDRADDIRDYDEFLETVRAR